MSWNTSSSRLANRITRLKPIEYFPIGIPEASGGLNFCAYLIATGLKNNDSNQTVSHEILNKAWIKLDYGLHGAIGESGVQRE